MPLLWNQPEIGLLYTFMFFVLFDWYLSKYIAKVLFFDAFIFIVMVNRYESKHILMCYELLTFFES